MARIKRLGVLQNAKFAAIFYLIISLIFLLPLGLVMLVIGGVAGSQSNEAFGGLLGGAAGAAMFMIIGPIFYAVAGAIGVALMCLVYNGISRIAGGIEIELED